MNKGHKPLPELSFTELLTLAREGVTGTLEELFRRSESQLDSWATQRAAHNQAGGARPSDVYQETALRGIQHFHTFRGNTEGEWFAWLKRILSSQAEQLLRDSRRKKRDAGATLPLDHEDARKARAQQPSPSQFTAQREEWSRLLATLARLPKDQREALGHYYLHDEELRVADVARRIGKTEDATASLLQRGLKNLRERLTGAPSTKGEGSAKVATALLAYFKRREDGKNVDLESFAARYPDCFDELITLLRWVDLLAALRPPATSPSPGLSVGEYQIVRRVAVGGTSEVHEGRHRGSGESVAVKVLRPELCTEAEAVARFLNEAQALEELRHPHVVRALASGRLSGGAPFMILEWFPLDLHRLLAESGGRLPVESCSRIVHQLAGALGALHVRGIIHRDLKPANVLLSAKEVPSAFVKLADLGLAKHTAPGDSRASAAPVSTAGTTRLGTWEYMAPEQWLQSKSASPAVDVYALGVLWFQMLAGRHPFIAEAQQDLLNQHLMEAPPFELMGEDVPEPVRELATRMLRKKPSERPTLGEIEERLSALTAR